MKLALIGHGAVAGAVLRTLRSSSGPRIEAVLCRAGRQQAAAEVAGPGIAVLTSIDELGPDIELVVECAGHEGLQQHGEQALRRGLDVLTVSIGALTDPVLHRGLTEAATEGRSRLHLASGAIGSLDAMAAAAVGGLDRVLYTGRKAPAGWRGSVAEDTIDLDKPGNEPQRHFVGSAGMAAARYPKNANVAAAVALAGIGFDDTEVELWSDPTVIGSVHIVEAEGAFGSLRFEIAGMPSPDSPRSSALTAMSVVAHIRRLAGPLSF